MTTGGHIVGVGMGGHVTMGGHVSASEENE